MPQANVNDVKLYYREAGSGEPIIFAHEFAGDFRSWEPQVRYFSRRYRCIVYNARGYPPSEMPEDVSAYSDADIGGAARVVHEGCRKALVEHLSIEPVRQEDEGVRVSLPEGFDASEIRLTGNVVGKPPFSGTLMHRGWRVSRIDLPKLAAGHEVKILAPAEVEL